MRIFKKRIERQDKIIEEGNVKTSEEISDEALIHAISGGALWAMEALYQRYHRLLYSFAYRIVADHQVAEDILQEAFLSVWHNASSYSLQYGGARAWVFSILHHRAIDHLRRTQRRAPLTAFSLDELDVDERFASSDAWDEVWQSVQRSQIREALKSLRTEQQMVIELAYFQGWTHREIAEGYHIPLGTVKARMRLGLLHLKRLLEQQGIHG